MQPPVPESSTARSPIAQLRIAATALLVSVVTAACGGPATSAAMTPVVLTATAVPTHPLAPKDPTWHPLTTSVDGVIAEQRSTTLPDGALVTTARFRVGQVHLALHVGSEDPVTKPGQVPAGAGNAITAQERISLVGVFNGGFKHPADQGGFMVDGVVILPLRNDAASLVLYSDGTFAVGAWNHGVPNPAKQVLSVRQNLTLLVDRGRAVSTAVWGNWGSTIGNSPTVARSAVGTDAEGNLYYVGSMHALPGDLAAVLVREGVRTAMELDINPYWPSLDTTRRPGGHLTTQLPGQSHDPSIYLNGWTRDFIVVTRAQSTTCAPSAGSGGDVNVFRQVCASS